MAKQTTTGKVPFNAATVGKCLCPSCPVQGMSQCRRGKMPGLKEALKAETLAREDIPAGYCASGTATCGDLDFQKSCICGGCPVYSRYQLDRGRPTLYFCRDGQSR